MVSSWNMLAAVDPEGGEAFKVASDVPVLLLLDRASFTHVQCLKTRS